jgi:hypothetical protein
LGLHGRFPFLRGFREGISEGEDFGDLAAFSAMRDCTGDERLKPALPSGPYRALISPLSLRLKGLMAG